MAKPALSTADAARRSRKLRCAIYTRKSSEEGLEQAFNSLDAQREACAAYIASQRHEGWIASPEIYDDGGVSGGTLERPALRRLLADVGSGHVDVVVVYKVDRLTRSLTDFARIVELFDKRAVSFVSVTQSFNTTTSMGRLTLNVLLSFAQFEREVTGERIRDKIAASKKKGLWMGGHPALGYDVHDRKLVVNEAEAAAVRMIFRLYCDLRSVRRLEAALAAEGVVSKRRVGADGRLYGGQAFSRGALYAMLANRVYRGETIHKGESYPGEHAAIVDAALRDEAQAILAGNRVAREVGGGGAGGSGSLLTGLIFDAAGQRMTPTHAVKKGARHRYYVSRGLIDGSGAPGSGLRLPAAEVEALVKARIRELLADRSAIFDAIRPVAQGAARQSRIIALAAKRADALAALDRDAARAMVLAIVHRIQAHADRIVVAIDGHGLIRWLDGEAEPDRANSRLGATTTDAIAPPSHAEPAVAIILTIPARLERAGMAMRFVLDDGRVRTNVDHGLTRLLARAHRIRNRLLSDSSLGVDEIAAQEQLARSYVTRLLRLTFLAPDIVSRILAGTHPPALTANKLMADTRLPIAWAEQRAALGFI